MSTPTVTVRAIKPRDWLELQWLASPARQPRSMIPGLLAERGGVPLAAIALSSGTVLADPGDPPADTVRSLRFLRYQALRQSGYGGAARSLLRGARTHLAACGDPQLTAGPVIEPIAGSVAEPSR